MKRLIRTLTFVALLAGAGVALARGSKIHVAGIQGPTDMTAGIPGDPCAAVNPQTGIAPAFSNVMAGSLIGCWYTDTFNETLTTPSGVIHATGCTRKSSRDCVQLAHSPCIPAAERQYGHSRASDPVEPSSTALFPCASCG